MLPKAGIMAKPKDEQPAQAQEVTPNAEPEKREPLTRLTILSA